MAISFTIQTWPIDSAKRRQSLISSFERRHKRWAKKRKALIGPFIASICLAEKEIYLRK
jgi:hypothetical protein